MNNNKDYGIFWVVNILNLSFKNYTVLNTFLYVVFDFIKSFALVWAEIAFSSGAMIYVSKNKQIIFFKLKLIFYKGGSEIRGW